MEASSAAASPARLRTASSTARALQKLFGFHHARDLLGRGAGDDDRVAHRAVFERERSRRHRAPANLPTVREVTFI